MGTLGVCNAIMQRKSCLLMMGPRGESEGTYHPVQYLLLDGRPHPRPPLYRPARVTRAAAAAAGFATNPTEFNLYLPFLYPTEL